jgi:membrane protein insertase Oxa1/YidC/SpoIIIJ
MMGMFVFQSAAGLGMYWLIGNIYSLVQMLLNHKFSDRKLEKLKKKLKLGE